MIISLVAMGLGVSLVPRRALALYGRRRALQRFLTPRRFKRKLVVVARRAPRLAPHVQEFLNEILF
ncbi:MAG TPA: LysR substrate-binding domain-containing protein [Chthoniobacteraceae bacterium]